MSARLYRHRSLPATLLITLIIAVTGCASTGGGPGQRADTGFQPPIDSPAFDIGAGPLVLIDEAHFNFHTAEGRYAPFAELLRRDGFVVRGSNVPFTEAALAAARVLVISNALSEDDSEEWLLPNPSAFTAGEIDALEAWVRRGGSLLLIADHMPFPGAAAELAEAFGLLFINGYARPEGGGRITFTRDEGSLRDHPITNGRSANERIDHVMSFTGQAFRPHPDTEVSPLLVLGDDVNIDMTVRASTFTETTPQLSAAGFLQGATLEHGAGRIAVFGEAAMFSAQLAGAQNFPMGMNNPAADQNYQFLLNTMRWLSGRLD